MSALSMTQLAHPTLSQAWNQPMDSPLVSRHLLGHPAPFQSILIWIKSLFSNEFWIPWLILLNFLEPLEIGPYLSSETWLIAGLLVLLCHHQGSSQHLY